MHHNCLHWWEDKSILFCMLQKRHGDGLWNFQEEAGEELLNIGLDESFGHGEELPAQEELSPEEEDLTWNLDLLFLEGDERPHSSRVRRRSGYWCGYVDWMIDRSIDWLIDWWMKVITLACAYFGKVLGVWVAPRHWSGSLERIERMVGPLEL